MEYIIFWVWVVVCSWFFLRYCTLNDVLTSVLCNEIYFTWGPEGYYSRPMRDLEMTLLGPFHNKRDATFAAYKYMKGKIR